MFGCYGRILTIDLTAGTAVVESIPDDILTLYLGGKGLARLRPRIISSSPPDRFATAASGAQAATGCSPNPP